MSESQIVETAELVDEAALAAAEPRVPEDSSKQMDRQLVFGSFWIDRTEFALPVDVIQEVVNEPESFTTVPLSPPHVLGLFCLRTMVIPVIDLRFMLGFSKREDSEPGKIAIIENGDLAIGLLFDDTGGVINGTGAARVDFQPTEDGTKDVIVEGVLKLEGGARMVQLLDPFEILRIKKLPRIAKKGTGDANSHKGLRLNCVSFQVGHTNCAIDLRFVQEITDVPEVQKSAIAHGHILGNIELRGKTMPIIDFRSMIGNEEPFKFSQEAMRNRKLVIMNLETGLVGLLVYSIDSIITFYESDILPFANVALPRHDVVAGCLVNDSEEIVILLDHARLLQDKMLIDAARSCQEIYPSKADEDREDSTVRASAERSKYILFRVGPHRFAFDISLVSEIIDRPKKLLKPPYALRFVDGILNLRGQLITLINPRILYNMPAVELDEPKVLIFHSGEKKYGMVVDSVYEIVGLQTTDLLPVPSILKQGESRSVSEDIAGCLPIVVNSADTEPSLVLDIQSLIGRCVEAEGMVPS